MHQIRQFYRIWIIFSLLPFVAFKTSHSLDVGDVFSSINKFLVETNTWDDQEPEDALNHILDEYDFIIVGAGTAGCVLANRLTQIPHWKVLLIEAGGTESYLMDVPLLATRLQFTDANWNYLTQPEENSCLGHQNGQCHWPRGKVMGGSSVLHSMIHTRGHPEDYNRWERLGNTGWNWDTVFPYFKKYENMEIEPLNLDTKYHSTKGELNLNYATWSTPLSQAFLDAGVETGGKVIDYNGENVIGYSRIHFTIRNGSRLSASRAFLHPIHERPNLDVIKEITVSKILINPKNKVTFGVLFEIGGKKYAVRARKEVIVSAGTINSAQLLMLSGIGPKNHLKSVGIKTIQNSKVGYNLQDHIAAGGIIFVINDTVSMRYERILEDMNNIFQYMKSHTGPLSAPTGCEAIAFLNTSDPTNSLDSYPDLELLFIGGSYVSDPGYKRAFNIDDKLYRKVYSSISKKDTWTVFPMLLLPKSKGRILLRDKNWRSKPLIYPNYYTDPADQEIVLRGIRKVQQLARTKAFQKYGSRLHNVPLPNCSQHKFDSDNYWYCAMRTLIQTIYHLTGTCKMGPATDPDAVVDPRLRVYGIKNLRVIDASIMPFVPAAHTNGPVLMIAEKGADIIKEDWGVLTKK